MLQHKKELNRLGVRVLVITFDPPDMVQNYVQRARLPWPLLMDHDQRLYRAYGMEKGSWWTLLGPATLWGYIKLIFGGRMPGKPGKDMKQLGGDVLIDPNGTVQFHRNSTGPLDRPDVGSVIERMEEEHRKEAK